MTIEEKIKYRQTEIQRAYDFCIDEQRGLEMMIDHLESEIKKTKEAILKNESVLRKIHERAIEQNCEHIL